MMPKQQNRPYDIKYFIGAITRGLSLSFLLTVAGTAWQAKALEAGEPPVQIIHAGHFLPVAGGPLLEEKSLIIEAGRLKSIEDGYVTQDGASIIDMKAQYILPGLFDMHVHLQGELGPDNARQKLQMSAEDVGFKSALFAKRTLMAGFTTVRDLGAESPQHLYALRRASEKGWLEAPRIIASGGVSVTGSHGDVDGMRHELLTLFTPQTICDGPYDCRRAVREAVKYGADVIKITATGGVLSDTNTGTGQQMADDEMQAIVEAAHALGRRVAAHAHATGGIEAALRAGVDSIEHGSYTDEGTIKLFKKNDAYLVPTLLAGATVVDLAKNSDFMSPDVKAKALKVGGDMAEHFREAYQAGVKIAYGTDSGVSHHGDNAREAVIMREAGMPEVEILKAATINAAELAGLSDQLGTLEVGKIADLIAVKENPLRDISTLLEVEFVMKEGRLVKKP